MIPQTRNAVAVPLPGTKKIMEKLARMQAAGASRPAAQAYAAAAAEINNHEARIEQLMNAEGDPVALGAEVSALQSTVRILRKRLEPIREERDAEEARISRAISHYGVTAGDIRRAVREYLDAIVSQRLELLLDITEPWRSSLNLRLHFPALLYNSEDFIPYNQILARLSGRQPGDICDIEAGPAIELLSRPLPAVPEVPACPHREPFERKADRTAFRTDEEWTKHSRACFYRHTTDPANEP